MTSDTDKLTLRRDEPMEIIPPNLGPLAAALAKAQSEFGAVTKDKTVTVTTKSGATYSFKYAPLDQILSVVKGPLSSNGLALTQLLNSDGLVTMLIHESGASLEARTPLPSSGDVQAYGSAITYLRRYAVQAMLGIAAEDDDDGNRAAGNQATPAKRASGLVSDTPFKDDGFIGTAEVGRAKDSDFELRETPEGWALGFKLKGNGGGFKVLTRDELALQLLDAKDKVVGKRVQVWGSVSTVDPGPGDKWRSFQVIAAERIKTEAGTLPVMPRREDEPEPIPVAEGQEALFDSAESARLDAEEAAKP
jgi:hypothetical protein